MNLDIISAMYRFCIRVYYKIQNYVGRKIDILKAFQKRIVQLKIIDLIILATWDDRRGKIIATLGIYFFHKQIKNRYVERNDKKYMK